MPAGVTDQGVVLHRRSWRETSAIVEVITRDHGRVSVVIKGYRSRKGMNGLLEPFRELQLGWSGRGEMYTLTHAELAGKYWFLNGQKLFCGLYVNELLWRMLPKHDPHPDVYQLYLETITALAALESHVAKVLRFFEKHLLMLLGFGLVLNFEQDQQTPVSAGSRYIYNPECGVQQDHSAQSIAGSSLLALHNEIFDQPGQLADARRLLRNVIQYQLGDVTLHSYKLLKKQ